MIRFGTSGRCRRVFARITVTNSMARTVRSQRMGLVHSQRERSPLVGSLLEEGSPPEEDILLVEGSQLVLAGTLQEEGTQLVLVGSLQEGNQREGIPQEGIPQEEDSQQEDMKDDLPCHSHIHCNT